MAFVTLPVTFASFPASRIELRTSPQSTAKSTRLTVNDLSQFIPNIVRDLQKLCSSHSSLFLSQSIKTLQSVLQLRPPGQPLEILP